MVKSKELKDVDVAGKRVLLRADLNIFLSASGDPLDTFKISALKDTFACLKGAKSIAVVTHVKKKISPLSPEKTLEVFCDVLTQECGISAHCLKELTIDFDKQVAALPTGSCGVFSIPDFIGRRDEEKFTETISDKLDVFVFDTFTLAHKNHPFVGVLAKNKGIVVGKLMRKEIDGCSKLLDPEVPMLAIIGGNRFDDKAHLIHNLMARSHMFCFGGGIANTFLFAQGYDLGHSFDEPDKLEAAQNIMLEIDAKNKKVYLPEDMVVADSLEHDKSKFDIPVEDLMGSMKAFDIGVKTIALYSEMIKKANTILWYGPMGVYEMESFRKGSKMIAEAIAKSDAFSVVAGGQTLGVLRECGMSIHDFDHTSFGSSSLIEFLSGNKMPVLELIQGKS